MPNNKKEKKGLVHERISLILAEVKAVPKDEKNKDQHYNYRSIDAVCAALHDLLAKHNVFYIPRVIAKDRQIIDRLDKNSGKVKGKTVLVALDVEYDFICSEDMSKLTVGPIIGEAMDFSDKASAKAQTMALKTLFLQLFCIPVQNSMDPDRNGKGNGDDNKIVQGRAKDLLADPSTINARKLFAQICKDKIGQVFPPDTMRVLCRDALSLSNTDDIGKAAVWLKEKGQIEIDDDGHVWLKELENAGVQ